MKDFFDGVYSRIPDLPISNSGKRIRQGYKSNPHIKEEIKPQRNEKCPCGSLKKYKFCCGK